MSGQHASDAVVAGWPDRIRECAARKTPISISGGGSKRFYGNAIEGEILDTRERAGIVDYEPIELVMVARAGTPLAEVESALAAERQMLRVRAAAFRRGRHDRWRSPAGCRDRAGRMQARRATWCWASGSIDGRARRSRSADA